MNEKIRKFKVIKIPKFDDSIKVGDILTVKYSILACDTLVDNNGTWICDLNSRYEREYCKEIIPMQKSIHITSDGFKTTTAVLKEGSEVVKKVEVNLHPKDVFSFEDGARLALDRLLGSKVKEEKKSDFKPYLDRDGLSVGVLGDKTTFTDVLGRPLYIGDTVIIYCDGVKGDDESLVLFDNERFNVMGLYGEDFSNGIINTSYNEFRILKTLSYKDVKDGKEIRGIKYVN